MAAIAMLVGGTLVNALAFTGSNFLFSKLGKSDAAGEDLRRQGHAARTFRNVDEAIRQYNLVSGPLEPIEPEPRLSDFYLPSPEQRDRETTFVVMGLGATAVAAYLIAK